jgi:glycosyltransferase involved in cell wall biosynthesis
MPKIRIVHIINSFEYGGAEAMLCNLLLRTNTDRFEPSVVSLIDDMTVAAPVHRAGIPLVTMNMKPGLPDPRGVVRLIRHLRRLRPDIIQCWMDHSNFIGGLAGWMCPGAHVIWGIHHSNHVAGLTKRSTLLTVSACAKLSRWLPSRIVCCSEHARELYSQRGFDEQRMQVIPNGFDTSVFRPNPEARERIRREQKLQDGVPVVGLVARYDPLKDHETFLRAAAVAIRARPDARFILCGSNVDEHNVELTDLIRSLEIEHACRLLGPRTDVADVYASLDVATSSSISEAFPLAVGEAMACGVPCVATDVGDSKLIVGKAGKIVPPRNPEALADAWCEILNIEPATRKQLGTAARDRINAMFELGAVTRRYEQLYIEMVDAAGVDEEAHECAAAT